MVEKKTHIKKEISLSQILKDFKIGDYKEVGVFESTIVFYGERLDSFDRIEIKVSKKETITINKEDLIKKYIRKEYAALEIYEKFELKRVCLIFQEKVYEEELDKRLIVFDYMQIEVKAQENYTCKKISFIEKEKELIKKCFFYKVENERLLKTEEVSEKEYENSDLPELKYK